MTETAAHSSQQPFEPPLTTLGKYCPSCHSVYLPPEAEANYWRQNAPVASTTKLAQATVQQEG